MFKVQVLYCVGYILLCAKHYLLAILSHLPTEACLAWGWLGGIGGSFDLIIIFIIIITTTNIIIIIIAGIIITRITTMIDNKSFPVWIVASSAAPLPPASSLINS